ADARGFPRGNRESVDSASSEWPGRRFGSRAQARDELADALAKAQRARHHLCRNTGRLPGCACQALSGGTGIAGFRNRLAARLSRAELFHACLQTLDRTDTPKISNVQGGLNDHGVAPDGSASRLLETGASVIPSLP